MPKAGLFIFQFKYLNKAKMPDRDAFMERLGMFLDNLPADPPYGVKIRNPRWMDASWFDFLLAHCAAPAFLQGYWMDDVETTLRACGGRIAGKSCVRLHGEDREGMEERGGSDWSRVIRPKDD